MASSVFTSTLVGTICLLTFVSPSLARSAKLPSRESLLSKRFDDLYIVGGDEVEPYSWPFLAQIGSSNDSEFQSTWCGGAIIDEEFILTAAHCFYGLEQVYHLIRITVGEHNISATEGYEQRREIERVINHADYNDQTLENDIALVKLKTPLDLTTGKAKAIKLNKNGDCPEDGQTCEVAGWGTLYSDGPVPDVANEVDVNIVNYTSCNETYQKYGGIFESNVCAGMPDGGKDSCQGDSGGPFVCTCKRKLVHVGIVSWGEGCALAGYPGVYTRTSSFIKWIKRTMRRERLRSRVLSLTSNEFYDVYKGY